MEKIAWDWGYGSFGMAAGYFPGPDSHFYSWLLALIYSFTGRAPLMGQGFSVLMGVSSVYLTWRLAAELWGEHHGRKAAWVMALFPTFVLYSSLTMREAYVVFFLLLGFISLVRWVRQDDLSSAFMAGLAFTAAGFFHGGMFLVVLTFAGVFAARHGRQWLASIRRGRIRLFSSIVLLGTFVLVTCYVVIGFDIPKLGSLDEMTDVGRLLHRFNFSNRGMASYPDWLVPKEGSEIFWKAPFRVVYFLFAPFMWDLDKASHLLGWLDGIFYMVIAFFFWRHWRAIWNMAETRAILLVLLPVVLVFGVAIGNFGTGLRHRTKFVACAIALTAPRIPRLILHRRMTRQTSVYSP